MKKGISLIILVITIILILIIAGSVILSLSQNNPINSASEATFKASLNEYISELSIFHATKYAQDTVYNPKSIFASTWDGISDPTNTIKDYIKSITVEDAKNYIIQQGKLIYVGTDTDKKQMTLDMGLKDPYVKDGLVLWLDGADFKNSPKTTIWIDRSSNYTPTVNNFSYNLTSGSTGGDGGVIFDGIDDYVNVGYTPALSLSSSYTWSVYCYTYPESNGNNIIIGNRYDPVATPTLQFAKLTKSRFEYYDGVQKGVTYTIPLNTWAYCTIVKDGTLLKYYYNGVLKNSVTIDFNMKSNAFYLGGEMASEFSKVIIKTVMNYSRALTDAEIIQNYNAIK